MGLTTVRMSLCSYSMHVSLQGNYQHLDIESVELSLMKPDGMSSEIPGIGSLRNDTATFAESGLE